MLIYRRRPADSTTAGATLTLTKGRLITLLAGDSTSAGVDIGGDPGVFQALVGVLQKGDPSFNIVTP